MVLEDVALSLLRFFSCEFLTVSMRESEWKMNSALGAFEQFVLLRGRF